MLSRVAESIYWLNRYIERAENYARFIEVNINLTLDLPPDMPEQWKPLVVTTGDYGLFQQRYGEPDDKDSVIQFLTSDRGNPNSILSCLYKARENARTVREIISTEMWEQINEFYLKVRDVISYSDWTLEMLTDFFKEIKTGSYLFAGIMDSTLYHSEGWHFGQMGRFIERADQATRILDVKCFLLLRDGQPQGAHLDLLQWLAVLKSASAFEMYRRIHGRINPNNIVQFLILDREFPRAIRYSLIQAEQSLRAISSGQLWTFKNTAEKRLGLLRSELDYTEISEIFSVGLHDYLDNIQLRLNEVSDAIYETFFNIPVLGIPSDKSQ
ncbi:MAG: alpha-E domain-containing protein [Deltaproteobacteria bacterium]